MLRYKALDEHLHDLHKFRKDFVPKSAGKKAKKACHKLYQNVRCEMRVIRVGEMALHKWKTVGEMRNKVGSGKLEKAAQEADK